MSMYSEFQTDTSLEQKGITIDYGSFRVMIARAGGANKKYARVLGAKSKPHRRAIQTENFDNDAAISMLKEVYAETVVLNWETKVDGNFKKGIESPDGPLLPVNVKNVIATFDALPDLFLDIQQQAVKAALFRQDILEADAKNS